MESQIKELQNQIKDLQQQIKNKDKVIIENSIAMEQANEYLKMAQDENALLTKVLQQIANQTDEEITRTDIGGARQIAIGALKEDQ